MRKQLRSDVWQEYQTLTESAPMGDADVAQGMDQSKCNTQQLTDESDDMEG